MAERGKTVRLFFIEGEPTGRLKCELSNWTGIAYRIPHTMVPKCNDRAEFKHTGIYFLIGKDEDAITTKVYIGETENVIKRLNEHILKGDKEWQDWTECVMFVSKDNSLNKAMARYLEYSLYMMVKNAGRCNLENKSIPTKSSLSETDENEVLEYLDNLRLVMGAMGYKFLENMESNLKKGETSDVCYIRSVKLNIDASGKFVDDGFIVFKGSRISPEVADGAKRNNYLSLRNKLIANGTISDNVFTKDYLFSSCSAASSVVKGYNTNGWLEWKNEDKKTLTDLLRERTE